VRRDLPWRRVQDPYATWVSEVMLQQTRVETVVPYYERFMEELPTVSALAEATSDRVMSLWSGLGYYRRARLLHDGAKQIAVADSFPRTADALGEVRGIGPYTAGAIASIAFGERAPLVDGNVARVLSRLFAVEEDVRGGEGLRCVWGLAAELVPAERPGDWNQALMELGATTCIPRTPRCLVCPVRKECRARVKGMESELPRLKPKAKPREALQRAFVVRHRDGLVLARRREGGLFGGLWEPPAFADMPTDADAIRVLEALIGRSVTSLASAGDVLHVLTHRRLTTRVFTAAMRGTLRPVLPEDGPYDDVTVAKPSAFVRLGMSTLARKILACAAQGTGA
jgi:A/G-specific adenine glycosylase